MPSSPQISPKLKVVILFFLRGYSLIITLLLLSATVNGQDELPTITAFATLDSLQAAEARPMVIFIHTDWCRYCRNMQKTSLRDPKVVEILHRHFYFLSLDAEHEEEISFRGHSFSFAPTGNDTGVHTLATALGTVDGQLQYPTLVIMNEDYEIIFQHGAFIEASVLIKILRTSLN